MCLLSNEDCEARGQVGVARLAILALAGRLDVGVCPSRRLGSIQWRERPARSRTWIGGSVA